MPFESGRYSYISKDVYAGPQIHKPWSEIGEPAPLSYNLHRQARLHGDAVPNAPEALQQSHKSAQ